MQLIEYENKGYTTLRCSPKKNEITAEAMYYIKEFINNTGSLINMEDWRLTKRQNQIMALLADGMDKTEVADTLEIGVNTVSDRLSEIYEVYGLTGDYKNSKAVVRFLKNIGRLEE